MIAQSAQEGSAARQQKKGRIADYGLLLVNIMAQYATLVLLYLAFVV
jgi:hypothetical protein